MDIREMKEQMEQEKRELKKLKEEMERKREQLKQAQSELKESLGELQEIMKANGDLDKDLYIVFRENINTVILYDKKRFFYTLPANFKWEQIYEISRDYTQYKKKEKRKERVRKLCGMLGIEVKRGKTAQNFAESIARPATTEDSP